MSEVLELEETFAGTHISSACEKAVNLATQTGKLVHFKFNDIDVTVHPNEHHEDVQRRWKSDIDSAHEAWINSPEYKEREEKRAAEDKAAREVVMVDNSATEAQMRESEVPWPKTQKQLNKYIESLVKRNQDYGTCVYAMSMAAVATFNYVAGQLGVTGFQSSCADMDIIRRTRGIKGPFMLIDGADALYPQYDLRKRLEESMDEWKLWLKEEATKKLSESNEYTHHDVIAHWEKLAALEIETEKA